jgi:hypothetical protein
MRIFVTGLSMAYLSGQPMYCYELCRELKRKKHDVVMVSKWDVLPTEVKGHDGGYLKEYLEKAGVEIATFENFKDFGKPDLIIASEKYSEVVLDAFSKVPAINVVHSEYEYETPMDDREQIIQWVCIRPSILAHITTQHGIPAYKTRVIYNGIDLERFKKQEKKEKDFYKIVVPCTLDTLREPFLNYMINSATKDKRVYIFGMYCLAKLDENEYAYISNDKFHIEEEYADADEVAGILLGRVNLEAWAMDIKTSIYDPDTLEHYTLERPKDFKEKYDIKKTTESLLNIYEDFTNKLDT